MLVFDLNRIVEAQLKIAHVNTACVLFKPRCSRQNLSLKSLE